MLERLGSEKWMLQTYSEYEGGPHLTLNHLRLNFVVSA